MGNSDSLAFVKSVHKDVENMKRDQVEQCFIQGDIIDEVMRMAPKNMEFSIYQTSEPITYDLPTRFEYESDYGKRAVSSISTFSLIGEQMKLNFEVEGLLLNESFIPLFDL
jgi:CRISPR-associated protein Cas5t